ncbi:MAG: ATP-binding cassette domain-containing protein [Anaerolineaceae bacterium]|jgi:Fe-S cluster assembly ATP-binding protein|nr:MAG: ATP-binding cassette domain-containing protein [Anaerolineaceae bacterium]
MDPILEIKQLTLMRNGKEILKELDLKLFSNQIHTLLGINGSGKSSLAYTLMGLQGYLPINGKIIFQGENVIHKFVNERARLGISLAWQEPVRIEGLPIGKYISLGMQEISREKVNEALEAVALPPKAYALRSLDESLSGGERKRVELAAVYAMQPKVAILDEPDSGIDVLSINDIGNLIQKMAHNGSAVLLITHRDELVQQSDVASLMCLGTIVYTGNPNDAMEFYQTRCQSHQQTYGAQPWDFGLPVTDTRKLGI